MGAHAGEHISVAAQFLASFAWVAGALLMGLGSAADYAHFVAALAWCVSNFAAAWALGWWSFGWLGDGKAGERPVPSGLSLSFGRLFSGGGTGDSKGKDQEMVVASGDA